MKQNLINDVIQGMLPHLNNAQIERLQAVLQHTLFNYDVAEMNKDNSSEQNLVDLFLSAKRIEGCSEKSLKYYKATIEAMIGGVKKEIKHIVTDDIRNYLTEYQATNHSSRVTIDNTERKSPSSGDQNIKPIRYNRENTTPKENNHVKILH